MSQDWFISKDGEAAVSTTQPWFPMETAPLKVKIQVLSHGGVATHTKLVTAEGRKDFKGWAPLPYTPK